MVQNIFTKALKIENSLLKSLHSSVNEIKDHGSVIKFYSAGKTNMQIIVNINARECNTKFI